MESQSVAASSISLCLSESRDHLGRSLATQRAGRDSGKVVGLALKRGWEMPR